MSHLGHIMISVIYLLADNHNKKLPFYFSKRDIKDSFWYMIVSLRDIWNFVYVLPSLTWNTHRMRQKLSYCMTCKWDTQNHHNISAQQQKQEEM